MAGLKNSSLFKRGVTLIELVIVVAVMGILLSAAVPSYQSYMLRVHRTEAIRLLLQAAMCQQRNSRTGPGPPRWRCIFTTPQQRYQLSYEPPATLGHDFLAMATPVGVQQSDGCGSLSINQHGELGISGEDISVTKCWSAR